MVVKNYVYGALEPTAGLEVVLEQFRLMHCFRNRLVELERERRAAFDAVVRRLCPELDTLERTAVELGERAKALADAVLEVNRLASASAGRPRIAATKEEKKAAIEAKKAAAEGWATFKAAKKAGYDRPDVRSELESVEEEWKAKHKVARTDGECGLYWGNKAVVEMGMRDFRSGPPPEFRPWRGEDRFRVAVQIQGGLPTSDINTPNTRAWLEEVRRPDGWQAESKRSQRRRHAVLHLRVQSDDAGKPVWATVPLLLHRPLPVNATVKWVYLLCRTVGARRKWEVMFTVDDRTPVGDHAVGGVVGLTFKARECEDGVEVARWAGDDGRRGRVVIPADQLGRFDEGSRLRSAIDVTRDLLRDLLGDWLSGVDRVVAQRPFENPARQGVAGGRTVFGFRGQLGTEFRDQTKKREDGDTPTAAEAVARIRQWRSPARFEHLHRWWADHRFDGDRKGFALLAEWVRRYRHLHDWLAHGSEQHSGWRRWLFRQVVATLRRQYKTAVIPRLGAGDRIERRPQLKAEGDGWTPPPDNPLRRVAAVGLLRQLLVESFADPREVPGTDAEDPATLIPLAAEGEGRVARRPRFAARHTVAAGEGREVG